MPEKKASDGQPVPRKNYTPAFKAECVRHGGAFTSLEEARLAVAYYLDTYFNPDRRHSALGYRSPHQFEVDLLQHPS